METRLSGSHMLTGKYEKMHAYTHLFASPNRSYETTNCGFVVSFYSSKALSSYQQIRRKYREQLWRLEQKVAAMMESHHNQSGASKAAGEDLEWKREETVL